MNMKSLRMFYRSKAQGTCKQGERADLTGCVPATDEARGGATPKPNERSRTRKGPDGHTFTTPKKADLWARKISAKWVSSLSEAERDAINLWKHINSPYAELNAGLRKGKIKKSLVEFVGNLDKAIAKSRVPQSVVVYRGVASPRLLKEGTTFKDKAFISTTFNEEGALGYAGQAGMLVKMTISAGSRAAYVDAFGSKKGGQHELLLGRGSRFRVSKIQTEEVEFPPHGHKALIRVAYMELI